MCGVTIQRYSKGTGMRKRLLLIAAVLCAGLLFGCGGAETTEETTQETEAAAPVVEEEDTQAASKEETPAASQEEEKVKEEEPAPEETPAEEAPKEEEATATANTAEAEDAAVQAASGVTLSDIPAYTDSPFVLVNDNVPFFQESEYTTEPFETYSNLDSLGRCGVAYANICQELMPTENRESISEIKPTGWHNNPYDFIDGGYLYNRCHLIAFELAGENANKQNLITGTRYFNVTGMLPFENMVADYVKETNNHVLYRVTPMFDSNNLVANGVLMEAYSVEDNGDGIEYCVFCYNVQPGVAIDYATGNNWADGTVAAEETATATQETETAASAGTTDESATYILNTSSKKFHKPNCGSVSQMSEKNKQEYTGSRQALIDQGYSPCGNCKP